jgi:putative hydrolase of the HAD superfamily
MMPDAGRKAGRGFDGIETWVFDLDNTLYPPALDLWHQIDARMRDFIARFLSIPHDEAFRLQKHYYRTHGTSLRGLMMEHGLKPEEFLEYVHDIDRSALKPDPALGEAIRRLQGRKLVLTNGSQAHAAAVLGQLGIADAFDGVYDIVAANFAPKPSPAAYDAFLAAHGVEPSRAAMFEDLARNLEVPHRLGMTTVLVVPAAHAGEVIREAWEHEGRDAPHVDHVTDDLAGFLAGIFR